MLPRILPSLASSGICLCGCEITSSPPHSIRAENISLIMPFDCLSLIVTIRLRANRWPLFLVALELHCFSIPWLHHQEKIRPHHGCNHRGLGFVASRNELRSAFALREYIWRGSSTPPRPLTSLLHVEMADAQFVEVC